MEEGEWVRRPRKFTYVLRNKLLIASHLLSLWLLNTLSILTNFWDINLENIFYGLRITYLNFKDESLFLK